MNASVRLGVVLVGLALVLAAVDPAVAQRGRARGEAWTAPVSLAVVPWPGEPDTSWPYRYVLAISATSEVELVADARLLRLEITVPGRRRPHRCEAPGRPRRVDEATPRTLRSGERWAEWVDLRELCWGRALEALEAGTEGTTVRATYEVGRGARAWVVRAGGASVRALVPVDVALPRRTASIPAPGAAEPAARVTLAAADVRRGAPTLRVAAYATGSVRRRAWLRPDRFRFHVVDPTGARFECRLPPTGGTPIPDLFSRLDARRGVRFSLDAAAYCGADAFETPGIYEVTPELVLDEDGAAWELDAIVGTFTGAAVPVRVRGPRGDRSVPAEVLRRILP